jgi:transposase
MVNKRKKYSPEEKAKIVLEVLREENTLIEISNKYEVSQQLISRWKSEFLANMPSVFDKKANETEKLKKQFEAEKAVLERKIGELTIDIDWLKKNKNKPWNCGKKETHRAYWLQADSKTSVRITRSAEIDRLLSECPG